MFELEYQKDWFSRRQQLYAKLARKKDLLSKTDSVFFRMGAPDLGCIDYDIFVNGKLRYSSMFSEIFDPFTNIRNWLESIVKGQCPIHSLTIETEGPQTFWIYEALCKDESKPDMGLFYVYDSSNDKMLFTAIVNKHDFVTAFYLALLDLASNGYNRKKCDFGKHWYAPQTLWHRTKRNNWTFYNSIKSPLIEWYLHPNQEKSCYPQRFRKMPKIRETIQMWCDYGHALFWGNDACIGDSDSISTDTAGEIDLSGIKGLYEWYDEWNKTPLEDVLYNDNEMVSTEWFERGRQLAFQVRELLPHTVDLYYCNWYPAVKVMQERSFDSLGNEFHFPERLPMIIPNPHALRIKK